MIKNSKKKQSADSKEKAKFRQTSVWKDFRNLLKKERKVDFITGKPLLKGYQLHHADMNLGNYKNLNPEHFFCLGRTNHQIIHHLWRYPNWRECLERIAYILELMDKLNDREVIYGASKKRKINV